MVISVYEDILTFQDFFQILIISNTPFSNQFTTQMPNVIS